MMREREIEKRLTEEIRKLGGKSYKWVSPGNTGVPDRIVILPGGKIYFVELKADTGSLRQSQKLQLNQLCLLGCNICVIRGEEGLQAFLRGLEKRYGGSNADYN